MGNVPLLSCQHVDFDWTDHACADGYVVSVGICFVVPQSPWPIHVTWIALCLCVYMLSDGVCRVWVSAFIVRDIVPVCVHVERVCVCRVCIGAPIGRDTVCVCVLWLCMYVRAWMHSDSRYVCVCMCVYVCVCCWRINSLRVFHHPRGCSHTGVAILKDIRDVLLSFDFEQCILLFSDAPDVDVEAIIVEARVMLDSKCRPSPS